MLQVALAQQTRTMAAKRYQLRLIGHGKLQSAGQHVMRITANATLQSVEDQVRQLFGMSADARIQLYDAGIDDNDEPTQQPTLVAISLTELVQGVLDYFSNDMEPSYLATSKPEVLIDAVVIAGPKVATATSSKSVRTPGNYHPKTWTPDMDALWPFCIPRYAPATALGGTMAGGTAAGGTLGVGCVLQVRP